MYRKYMFLSSVKIKTANGPTVSCLEREIQQMFYVVYCELPIFFMYDTKCHNKSFL